MFKGFEQQRIRANGVEIELVKGGGGPSLLLLHGHPQTHVIWHRIAEQLTATSRKACRITAIIRSA